MTQAENHYFSLLRSALWGTPVTIENQIDWASVLSMAAHHGNNVLLSDVASRLTGDNKPSPKALASMQAEMRGNLFNQMKLRQILVSAVNLLRQHDIEPVVLKGFGLAMLYPNPSLRQFGDIDLFVGLSDFHPACEVLRSLPGSYNWGEEVDAGKHYNLEFGNMAMEIHRVSADVVDVREHEAYSRIEHEGLVEHTQRVDLDGFEITIPSKEFMVFFTFYHAWHHFLTTGVGWRQLSDVAIVLHAYRGQLDLGLLRQWLEAMHLMQPWQTFGWLMVDCLGLSKEELPFYNDKTKRKAAKLYGLIMKEGNFKRERRFSHRLSGRFMQRGQTFFRIFSDFFHLAKVFPNQAFREMLSSLKHGLEKNTKKSGFFC